MKLDFGETWPKMLCCFFVAEPYNLRHIVNPLQGLALAPASQEQEEVPVRLVSKSIWSNGPFLKVTEMSADTFFILLWPSWNWYLFFLTGTCLLGPCMLQYDVHFGLHIALMVSPFICSLHIFFFDWYTFCMQEPVNTHDSKQDLHCDGYIEKNASNKHTNVYR